MAKTTRKRNVGTAKRLGYRSGLEEKVATKLKASGVEFGYETTKIKYVVPESVHNYTPDFVFPSGVIVETKGRFVLADRKKHLLIQQQHPELDIRFVFSNSKAKINKGSKTNYGDWCNQHGFMYSDKEIPEEWLRS